MCMIDVEGLQVLSISKWNIGIIQVSRHLEEQIYTSSFLNMLSNVHVVYNIHVE